MKRRMLRLVVAIVLLFVLLPWCCMELKAATLSELTCEGFISNETNRAYIDMMMRHYISANSKLETALNNGRSVVFMYEGGSDNAAGHAYSASGSNTRDQAVAIVVQKINGSYEIVFYSESCSSIPSQPEDTVGAYANGMSQTTILDGIYRIQTCNHQGDYGALNVITSEGYYTPPSNKDGYVNGASGINIHTRSSKTAGGLGTSGGAWSAGCQLVGYGGSQSNKYNKFMKAVAGIDYDVWINYSASSFEKVTAYQDVGYYVLDRQLATSALTAIYTPTAISNITAYSRKAYSLASNMATDLGTDFYAYLGNPASGNGICNINGNVELGESITTGAMWRFTKSADGSYYIKSLVDGGLLTAENAGTANKTNLCVSTPDYSASQRWYIQQTEAGYSLLCANSYKALDIASGGTEIGTNIQLYTANGTAAQIVSISQQTAPGFTVSTNNIGFHIEDSQTILITVYGFFERGWNIWYSSRNGALSGSWGDWYNNTVPLTLRATSTDDTWLRITLRYADPDATVAEQVWSPVILQTASSESQYTVHYDANGGIGAPEAFVKVHGYSVVLSSMEPMRSGYTFLGWSTDAGATSAQYVPGGLYTKNQHAILYAVWQSNSYTVHFDANGGLKAPADVVVDSSGLVIPYTVPIRVGYNFAGWSTGASGFMNRFYPGDIVGIDADQTLYAIWDSAPSVYELDTPTATISMREPGGKWYAFTPSVTTSYAITDLGEDFSVDTVIELYDSNGNPLAMDDDSGDGRKFDLRYTLEQGQTYYLYVRFYSGSTYGSILFGVVPGYRISYDTNGGTGAPDAHYCYAALEDTTLSTTEPTRAGYTFLGWLNGNSVYPAGASFCTYSDAVLIALWEKNTAENSMCALMDHAGAVSYYRSVNEALLAAGPEDYVQLIKDVAEDITVSEDAFLDLNGFDITGSITIADGAALYLFDSATSDYTAHNRGAVRGTVTGALARSFNTPASYGHNYKYLTLQEKDGSWTSHRYYLSVRSAVLVPVMQGEGYTGTALNYKTHFKCNEVVAEYVTAYGTKLTGESVVYANALAGDYALLSGNANSNTVTTNLTGTMRSDNSAAKNAANAAAAPAVNAYIVLADGIELTSATVQKSLRQVVAEAVEQDELAMTAQMALGAMYDCFQSVLDSFPEVDIARLKKYSEL